VTSLWRKFLALTKPTPTPALTPAPWLMDVHGHTFVFKSDDYSFEAEGEIHAWLADVYAFRLDPDAFADWLSREGRQ
jgi:hypothetical protein